MRCTRLDGERQVVDRDDLAVSLGEIVDDDLVL
jgi:hypothetical protein